MDPDACRNCGHSGKHIDFLDYRCAITERDDAERDKLQADAGLERARELCETSLSLMKRQMQELEDANDAIETLSRALAAAEDRRERIRRDLGTHGDVCLTARSNVEAAEEMAIAAAGRYFEAGRAVTALEERDQRSPGMAVDEEAPATDDDEDDEGREARGSEDRRWKRSNERFCRWLRQSEAQRQIMKSSWTKVRVAERLASESESVDDEEVARRARVQEWTVARRLTDQLPPEEDSSLMMMTEDGGESELIIPAPVLEAPKSKVTLRSPVARTRARAGRAAPSTQAASPQRPSPQRPSPQKASPQKAATPATARALRGARRVESQTRSEPTRPTAPRVKKESAPSTTAAGTTASSEGASRPARTRAKTGKAPAADSSVTAAAGRPQRVTRRKSRAQPYPQPGPQPRWK